MSGFETYNTAGALVVSSDFTGTYLRDSKAYGSVTDAGYYSINTPIGNGTDMGYISNPYPADANLLWFKFNDGTKIMFNGGDSYGTANSGTMARTGVDVGTTSGYLDVFNAAGALVWSAVTAAKIPRVLGFFDIPSGFDLDNSPYSQNIGTGTYLLASAAPANLGGDGGTSGYSGLMFSFSGGVLSAFWPRQNQQTWAATMKNYGLRIPYAVILNL
ncbi:MAG: hypothetical protein ACOH2G_04880 [Ewingella sp.]